MLVLPPADGGADLFALEWQHDNNGDTFIVSSVQLDYLVPGCQMYWHEPIGSDADAKPKLVFGIFD